ncbi:hypothetical protein SERLADRAFT_452048 [Serpula lacrymans var. lacrymans S7.9]|uniref:Hamartin n=1 Tax=Serpula lacrymans var. lacrymans (strain S7.9) TaxID=578457 RepID=F8P639_SERL9|nr:uncharacterized protein SERLADRAFT_452048 [Serpula lacrymans var. lacrymans S7.9]EGO20906.1 hypothetical protein SERLADRAFT_452048 [Serpula lacrymans var. lacrymans S7.9]
MSIIALSHQVRVALQESADAEGVLAQTLAAVDEFVVDCCSSDEPEVLLFHLEEDLQNIHNEAVDHTSLYHTEVFLALLYHLRPIISSTSIISTWFDLVLRPALREPRLPTIALNHATELIIHAAEKVDERYPEKVGEFRRRLLDLYLLDAYNEGSGEDILEWAELSQVQREKKSLWKSNLEDILVKFGLQQPQELMTEINECFATPSSRLQLLILLNYYTSQEKFRSPLVLANHPLIFSLLSSLLLDNSSTICTIGLTVLVKLLPIFAVEACDNLKSILPQLLAILARIICWKERPVSGLSTEGQGDETQVSEEVDAAQDLEEPSTVLQLHPELDWKRLELTFNAARSSAPPPENFFSCLYYLFPSNLFRFLRGPAIYLKNNGFDSPYTVNWEEALDEDNIRSRFESLLRGRVVNSRVIWRDATEELSQPNIWERYDVSRISSECSMLDVRNAVLGSHQESPEISTMKSTVSSSLLLGEDETSVPTPHPGVVELTVKKPRISLQDMITTSVALKSNLDVEIEQPSSQWSSVLFPPSTSSPSKGSVQLPSESEVVSESGHLPTHVAEAISALQREVILLRNELNFELWLSRENMQHIGRLYQDRILSKNAEAERQGLFNKLRQYRAQVQSLERELKEHKAQSSSARNKYADWNTELQKKLRDFREEKKSWVTEAAALRSAEKEAKTAFVAQGKLLADATKEVFELQTQKKENQHKIDRLHDYERQIEQHIKMQRLWDSDFEKFNQRAEEMQSMITEYRKMEIRLECYEKTQSEMNDNARCYRRQIQALEARLTLVQKRNEASRHLPPAEIAAFIAEKSALMKMNKELRDENADLRDEVEEMMAMLEVLKAQISGHRGLISEPRSSPTLSSSLPMPF